MKTIILSIISLMNLFFLVSCYNAVDSFKLFNFSPDNNTFKNSHQYKCKVIVTSRISPITTRSAKKVKIIIFDQTETLFLEDSFKFVSADIQSKVFWDKFEEVKIWLFERGYEHLEDDYNKQLFKSGPKKLTGLIYHYDSKDKKFKRVN